MRLSRVAIAAAPVLFVLLWSTGFIGARYGLPYIEPLTFLAVRMVFVVLILGAGTLFWLGAFAFEPREIHWNGELVFAMAWLVIVLSIAGMVVCAMGVVVVNRGSTPTAGKAAASVTSDV
jgi:drug/metabolite transporter (DMT)-like permease